MSAAESVPDGGCGGHSPERLGGKAAGEEAGDPVDEGEGLIRGLEIRFFERLRGLLQSKSFCLIIATRRDLHELFQEHRQTTSPLPIR